ncbi:MAG: hypothetical protein GWN84_18045 [Gammaproteobacteria bacterium]|nr:hypothetical protein [Gammaproteobacteria bacterium]NIR84743.1 hypothetical protein [Gammaproteobacteria bacterium]NIR91239.1 hypothetical protein [Gammaproteobacteria bacterium]NIU05786.1 hypothetical protein [Gammaproteobacteria bacterium]NIV52905.1 hypothetical protein [Gammaproteobacteria bacterium]
MSTRRRYRKKAGRGVVAVRLDLDTDGFTYHKWGAEQTCKRGDWVVDNEGDVYTVDAEVFDRTYRRQSRGVFVKSTPVWAEVATEPGSVITREGESHYEAGDYLVYNNEDGTDAYCVGKEKFEEMYEPDD